MPWKVGRSVLAALVLSAVLAPQAPAAFDLTEVEGEMHFPGVDVGVMWERCGQPNAFYFNELHEVVMCSELLDVASPGAIRFIAAHELAHATMEQLDLPIVGNIEDAADELAAIMLNITGHEEDVLEAAIFIRQNFAEHVRFDPHGAGAQRGENLVCLSIGNEGGIDKDCDNKFSTATRAWQRLIKDAEDVRDGNG